MGLESVMICVDNSDFMRNGDYSPNRMQAQLDAVNLVCLSKSRSNAENGVGLIAMSNRVEVLATLTSDVGKIFSKLHSLKPGGNINFCTGLRIAQLALKHRLGKNHAMKVVVFVGSPVLEDEKELQKVAKKFSKEKITVDIVSFGESAENSDILTNFINFINETPKDGVAPSNLITVPPGPHLSDALISSSVIRGEDGSGGAGLVAGSGFGYIDPNDDPELALALRVSMEEQHLMQNPGESSGQTAGSADPNDAALARALEMSMEGSAMETDAPPDFGAMTEDEQIAFALRMSMQESLSTQQSTSKADAPKEDAMDVDAGASTSGGSSGEQAATSLKGVLDNLPGMTDEASPEKEEDKKDDEK